MYPLIVSNATFPLKNKHNLKIPNFQLKQAALCVVVGKNGSGKTAFSDVLSQRLTLSTGHYENKFKQISLFSFEKQQQIIEQIVKARNNDMLDPDDFGQTASEIILNGSNKDEVFDQCTELLGITHLLNRPFIQLSTGESRKVLFAQTLVAKPDLLILDEPFEGLDQQSLAMYQQLLLKLRETMAIVLIVNRFSDIPPSIDKIAILDNFELSLLDENQSIDKQALFQQMQFLETANNVPLPTPIELPIQLDPEQNPFELENVTIQYADKVILSNLSWIVKPNQHWWIKGPNGAGKSTLLSVINGDHPQSFANKVRIFGKQRGSGETIWQIKQHLGYVSHQLHLDYRVNCRTLEIIVSGFLDSIGVYQHIPDRLRLKAIQWLERLNMVQFANKPFRSLSWGQQRLLLIARAMVKHPPILILDEPLLGLDGFHRRLIKSFIDQMVNNSHTQLLFVSHQEQDAPDCITHSLSFVKQKDIQNGTEFDIVFSELPTIKGA